MGVYTLMFEQYSSVGQMTTLIVVLVAMTWVWCIAGYCIVNHPLVASKVRYIGHIVLPFILMGLGIHILAKPFV